MVLAETRVSYKKWKIVEKMCVFLFILAPLYFHPNIGGGFTKPNNVVIWFIAVVFIAYTLLIVVRRESFHLPTHFIFVLAFPILATLSAFIVGVSNSLDLAIRLSFIWGGMAFFFSLFQYKLTQGRVDRVLFIIVISGAIFSAVGLLQLMFKANLPFWLPTSENGIPSTYFQQINNQVSYLATIVIIAFFLGARPFIIFGHAWKKRVLVFTVLIATYVIAVSGSRTGLLGLTIALPLMIWANCYKTKGSNRNLFHILLISVVLGTSLGLISKQDTTSKSAITKMSELEHDYSSNNRLGIYKVSIDLIKERPFTGYGIGSFPKEWQLSKAEFYKNYPGEELPSIYIDHPHNEILLWLVEGGTIAFLGILISIMIIALRLTKSGKERGISIFAILFPISLHTQVELPFYTSALHWFLFLFILFVLFRPSIIARPNKMSVAAVNLLFGSILVVASITLLSFLHTLKANWEFVEFYQGKQTSTPFSYAYDNPYVSHEAQRIYMTTIFYDALQNKNVENMKIYITWARGKIPNRPDIDLYKKLSMGYQLLGQKLEFCGMIKDAYTLYPNAGYIKQNRGSCVK